MTFDDVLEQVVTLLKRQGRVSYGALKMRFDLDDAYLDVLKEELLYVHPGDFRKRICLFRRLTLGESQCRTWVIADRASTALQLPPLPPSRAQSPLCILGG
jgi:hypothetical protein